MCLILIAHLCTEKTPLLVLANRDEYYDRPAAEAAPWDECSELIAGRDLASGGSWFGARGLRWAGVTNVREGMKQSDSHRSRGWLVRDYLLSMDSPQDFLSKIASQIGAYPGFNLLAGNGQELWYCSNRGPVAQRLEPGIYGLSNHLIDTPWPKVKRGKEALRELMSRPQIDYDRAFAILADTTLATDADLPDTGIPLEWERSLSAAFISTQDYGTRCSTLLMRTAGSSHFLVERRFAVSPESWEESSFSWTA
jgi:uncharacterized protein with NRDE domain